jgi:2-polyprenyl-3-methyl-5-hydroxy-6-metoxy-1,4-benzoquinol methylase
MIKILTTEGLTNDSYIKVMNEILDLRKKQLKHKFKISLLGTQSLCYTIFDMITTPFKKRFLEIPINFLQIKLKEFLKSHNRILVSYINYIWTIDIVFSSTEPAVVRHVEYPWAVKNAHLEKNMKILDIGSGVSLLPVYLASKGHNVISIDNDEILMERLAPNLAKWSGVNVDYKIGTATKLNFEDNYFDRIFCISVLEHLEEEKVNGEAVNYHKLNLDIKAISEMIRVVKPNGLIILTFDWSENPKDLRSYKLEDIYERALKPFKAYLVEDKKPVVYWETAKEDHLRAWKSFPSQNYIDDGWAVGVILKKKS